MSLHVHIVSASGCFERKVGDCDEQSRVLILTPDQSVWLKNLIEPEETHLCEAISEEGQYTVFTVPLHWARDIIKQITDYDE